MNRSWSERTLQIQRCSLKACYSHAQLTVNYATTNYCNNLVHDALISCNMQQHKPTSLKCILLVQTATAKDTSSTVCKAVAFDIFTLLHQPASNADDNATVACFSAGLRRVLAVLFSIAVQFCWALCSCQVLKDLRLACEERLSISKWTQHWHCIQRGFTHDLSNGHCLTGTHTPGNTKSNFGGTETVQHSQDILLFTSHYACKQCMDFTSRLYTWPF